MRYGTIGLFLKEINPRVGLEFEFVERTDLLQKPKRPMITAHHQMLAVINRVPSGFIRERIGASAKERAALEQQNSPPRLSQINRGGEPGEAATQNQDKGRGGQGEGGTGGKGDEGNGGYNMKRWVS